MSAAFELSKGLESKPRSREWTFGSGSARAGSARSTGWGEIVTPAAPQGCQAEPRCASVCSRTRATFVAATTEIHMIEAARTLHRASA
jgi:hypothetical protein